MISIIKLYQRAENILLLAECCCITLSLLTVLLHMCFLIESLKSAKTSTQSTDFPVCLVSQMFMSFDKKCKDNTKLGVKLSRDF